MKEVEVYQYCVSDTKIPMAPLGLTDTCYLMDSEEPPTELDSELVVKADRENSDGYRSVCFVAWWDSEDKWIGQYKVTAKVSFSAERIDDEEEK